VNIYLDDNFTEKALCGSLRKAGHLVRRPGDFGLQGVRDPRHLACAIVHGLVLLTKDRIDFGDLHFRILAASGRHPGILVVRYENDTKRDMKTKHIVAAVGKVERSGLPLENEWIVLNQWR
jgi:hypothetical protein